MGRERIVGVSEQCSELLGAGGRVSGTETKVEEGYDMTGGLVSKEQKQGVACEGGG